LKKIYYYNKFYSKKTKNRFKEKAKMKWQIKFAKNALFGLLPFSETIRKSKRKMKPYSPVINKWTLEQGIRQVEMISSIGYRVRGKTLLEVGTGWMPIIPIIFFFQDAGK
jgi:hypothetical protein